MSYLIGETLSTTKGYNSYNSNEIEDRLLSVVIGMFQVMQTTFKFNYVVRGFLHSKIRYGCDFRSIGDLTEYTKIVMMSLNDIGIIDCEEIVKNIDDEIVILKKLLERM